MRYRYRSKLFPYRQGEFTCGTILENREHSFRFCGGGAVGGGKATGNGAARGREERGEWGTSGANIARGHGGA